MVGSRWVMGWGDGSAGHLKTSFISSFLRATEQVGLLCVMVMMLSTSYFLNTVLSEGPGSTNIAKRKPLPLVFGLVVAYCNNI